MKRLFFNRLLKTYLLSFHCNKSTFATPDFEISPLKLYWDNVRGSTLNFLLENAFVNPTQVLLIHWEFDLMNIRHHCWFMKWMLAMSWVRKSKALKWYWDKVRNRISHLNKELMLILLRSFASIEERSHERQSYLAVDVLRLTTNWSAF